MGPSARWAAATLSLPSSAALYNGRHCAGRRRNVGVRPGTCAVWPLPWSPSGIGTAQRSHRLSDHLERPRRQRGKCRGQLRAAVGSIVCWSLPLTREHHGDDHLEPLHTSASASTAACVAALRPCAIGCSHASGSVGVAIRARARLDISTVLASSGVLYAYAAVRCACAAAARRGWRRRTSVRKASAAAHSCAAKHETAVAALAPSADVGGGEPSPGAEVGSLRIEAQCGGAPCPRALGCLDGLGHGRRARARLREYVRANACVCVPACVRVCVRACVRAADTTPDTRQGSLRHRTPDSLYCGDRGADES